MKRILLLIFAIVFPILFVTVLAYVTLHPNRSNGFTRKIKQNIAIIQIQVKTPLNLIDICGSDQSTIYFRTKYPNQILSYDTGLKKTSHFMINLAFDQKLKNNYTIIVDSPEVKIFAGNYPAMVTMRLIQTDSAQWNKMEGMFYTEVVQYAEDRYIIRKYEPKQNDYLFTIINGKGEVLKREKHTATLKNGNDISTQGTLLYSKEESKFYFVYKLFNSIKCLDTNLNNIFTFHTIDTVTTPEVKTTRIANGDRLFETFNSPLRYTNFRACVYRQKLFVYSRLPSDTDLRDEAVIDIYDLQNGTYNFSFHLPGISRNNMKAFKVNEQNLYAICDNGNKLVKYKLEDIF